jgi:hypothetical protein
MSRFRYVVLLSTLLFAVTSTHAQGVQRAFVSALGSDNNTSFSCDAAHPCRYFQAAINIVEPNGEVIALDSGGYGSVTINKSVGLIAPSGVHAGISVFSGANGVTVNTPSGSDVVLRGLTIRGKGGENGIFATGSTKLTIENCVIQNFNSGFGQAAGIRVSGSTILNIADTVLRDNSNGIELRSLTGFVNILRTQVLGPAVNGISAINDLAGGAINVAIRDTLVSGANIGVLALAQTANGNVNVSVVRSTIVNTVSGLVSQANDPAANSVLTVSESSISKSETALVQSGAGAKLRSLRNNAVDQNTTNTAGTITAVAPL